MIFERRAYTFQPGKLDAFWDAQIAWNTEAVFGPIRKTVICYFSSMTGAKNQIVHLYRFESLEQWQSTYAQYYIDQKPEYFALVRPWMLRQENSFLARPPVNELAALWTGEPPMLPAVLDRRSSPEAFCVVETTLSFFPGGLPAYWKACQTHRVMENAPGRPHLMAELVSLIGRLHRVYRYEAFASAAEALQHMETRATDPRWRAFVGDYAEWIADEEMLLLEPTPLESRRPLATAGSATPV